MNEDAAAFAAKVADELDKHTDEWREDFFTSLKDQYCTYCGERTEGGTCWVCYSSPPENFDD